MAFSAQKRSYSIADVTYRVFNTNLLAHIHFLAAVFHERHQQPAHDD